MKKVKNLFVLAAIVTTSTLVTVSAYKTVGQYPSSTYLSSPLGFGKVKFGMTLKDVEKTLGGKLYFDSPDGKDSYYLKGKKFFYPYSIKNVAIDGQRYKASYQFQGLNKTLSQIRFTSEKLPSSNSAKESCENLYSRFKVEFGPPTEPPTDFSLGAFLASWNFPSSSASVSCFYTSYGESRVFGSLSLNSAYP